MPLALNTLAPGSGDIKSLLFVLLVAAGLLAWLVRSALAGELAWPRTKANLPILVLLGIGLLSLAFSPFLRASATETWRLLSLAGFFFLVLRVAQRRSRVVWIARVMAATAGIVAAYGVLQRFGLDPVRRADWLVRGRAYSSCGHPNILAAYLVMTLPVTVSFFLSARSWKGLVLWGLDAGLQALCLVFTFSRGGWLGALAAAGMFLLLAVGPSRLRFTFTRLATKGWTVAGVILVAVVVGVLVGSEYSPFSSRAAGLSIETRKLIYEGSLRMAAARPVRGCGIPGTPTAIDAR